MVVSASLTTHRAGAAWRTTVTGVVCAQAGALSSSASGAISLAKVFMKRGFLRESCACLSANAASLYPLHLDSALTEQVEQRARPDKMPDPRREQRRARLAQPPREAVRPGAVAIGEQRRRQ